MVRVSVSEDGEDVEMGGSASCTAPCMCLMPQQHRRKEAGR